MPADSYEAQDQIARLRVHHDGVEEHTLRLDDERRTLHRNAREDVQGVEVPRGGWSTGRVRPRGGARHT